MNPEKSHNFTVLPTLYMASWLICCQHMWPWLTSSGVLEADITWPMLQPSEWFHPQSILRCICLVTLHFPFVTTCCCTKVTMWKCLLSTQSSDAASVCLVLYNNLPFTWILAFDWMELGQKIIWEATKLKCTQGYFTYPHKRSRHSWSRSWLWSQKTPLFLNFYLLIFFRQRERDREPGTDLLYNLFMHSLDVSYMCPDWVSNSHLG